MAVRLLLQDPATGQFSNQRFEELKGILIAAMQRAEGDYQRTLAAANAATGSFRAATVQEAGRRLKASLLANTRPRLDRFQAQLKTVYDANSPFWDDAAAYANFLRGIENEISLFQTDADTLQTASDLSFYAALSDRAREILGDLYAAGSGVVTPALWALKNLPYILVGGAVLFFVIPPAFRALAAYKRGGAADALDTAAGSIETGRGRIAAGAKVAAKAALL